MKDRVRTGRCEMCYGAGSWSGNTRCGCGSVPPDELPWLMANHYACQLTTIGPGLQENALDTRTIANDLVAWCRGAVLLDGRVWAPEHQADWLVTTARWSWHHWKGSAQLLDLFRTKFEVESATGPSPRAIAEYTDGSHVELGGYNGDAHPLGGWSELELIFVAPDGTQTHRRYRALDLEKPAENAELT